MSKINSKFRVYHRYLGFFLAGIMCVYALSGTIMIFRTTDFLKYEKQVQKELQPNITKEELGRALFIRDFKVLDETDDIIKFSQGNYNKKTGIADYTVKEIPVVLQKLEGLHKATTNSPLFFMNVLFGISLLFFSVSAFFMYARGTKVFRKGVYVAIAGVLFAIIMILF